MVFSSPLFLSLFLPTLLLLYMLAGAERRNGLLLCASLFFYSWGEPRACLVMLGLILVNYLAARQLERMPDGRRRVLVLAAAVAAIWGRSLSTNTLTSPLPTSMWCSKPARYPNCL